MLAVKDPRLLRQAALVGAHWTEAEKKTGIAVTDPAKGNAIGYVPTLGANDTEFGFASHFYTRDLSRIWRVGEALESGMVGINTGPVLTAEAPFGGVKMSALGREGSHHGLDDFTELKYLCMNGINAADEE